MLDLNLDKNKRYLLACSFGPDSMALFYLLQSQGYSFDCAIVNYHIREESTSEVNGLIEYASKFNVKVFVHDCGRSLENLSEAKCRDIRYSFFARLMRSGEYECLLVAHHQDDNIETYILQKQRQNCPIYYGIKEKTVINGMTVCRPLLRFSKKDLMEVCADNHVPYAIDKTNFDVSIIRNKIRHEVVAKMNESTRQNVLKEIDRKNEDLSRILDSIDLVRIHDVDYILSLDKISVRYALNVLVKYIKDNYYLSKENVGEIIKALKCKKPNVFFRVKHGVYFVKEYDKFDLLNKYFTSISYQYMLDNPGRLNTPYFRLDFRKNSKGRNVKDFDYPLTIRNAKLDDCIFINGYKVKARRLFIDWKMPLRLRVRWPIILNKNDEPLYIPRYQKDFVPSKDSNFYVKF